MAFNYDDNTRPYIFLIEYSKNDLFNVQTYVRLSNYL